MCGISGAIAPDIAPQALAAAVNRMVAALHHRGPDSAGTFTDHANACALGHARLSIIDLSEAGQQPMLGPQGRMAIVFNGEVYNFRELRMELAAGGRQFVSRTDTEVVLAAYERWGIDAFLRLNGMFAFALLDRVRGCLVLARDRLGIKPLYVARAGRRFVFASEIKAIVNSGLVDTAPDLSHLHEFLHFGNTLGEASMYRDITRLPPAHWIKIDLASGAVSEPERYWAPPSPQSSPPSATEEAIATGTTRTLLEAAVKRQLVSDVPVGVFLSGGIDSTAIVALAARHYHGQLRTYSVGFDYIGDGQELPKARWVAKRFGTEHHELHVGANDREDIIERTSAAHDQPFADPANLPLYQLCQALGGETKVILQGDGGDEIFGGYRRYEYLRAAALTRPMAAAACMALSPAQSLYGRRLFGAHRFFHSLARSDEAARMGGLLSVEGPLNPPTRILNAELRATVLNQDPLARYREVIATLPATDELQRMLLTDLQILLPDIFLEKVDRSTMAMSIEVRVPFLDFDLVDYVTALPSSYKVGIGRRKKLLRSALQGIVPDRILNGRKTGFGVPISAWLAGPLRSYAEDRILAHSGPVGWFDASAVRALFDEHTAGRRDNAQLLWKALQCALWRDRLQVASARH
jgi:asparagine synthase (glutamine-hydrolysing)